MTALDDDLSGMPADALRREVQKLRTAIRQHRDASGHALCWHHPALWALLPEPAEARIKVPAWPQFLRGCVQYRQSLDQQLPAAPRSDGEFGE